MAHEHLQIFPNKRKGVLSNENVKTMRRRGKMVSEGQ
jgi:hypothetical protein